MIPQKSFCFGTTGFAALTMDDEYAADVKRAQNEVDGGTNVAHNLQAGAKGIVGGLTGIFTDPVKGAKQDGAKGFLKGCYLFRISALL